MRSKFLFGVLVMATMAYAKEPKTYQTAKILKMESVNCGVDEKDGQSLAGEMLGTDSNHKKTHELLCQEYVLQTQDVVYRIRPRDQKHPVLLPVGERAQFRIDKDKLLLRVEDLDSKNHQYDVVSIAPRTDGDTASTDHPNHLQ